VRDEAICVALPRTCPRVRPTYSYRREGRSHALGFGKRSPVTHNLRFGFAPRFCAATSESLRRGFRPGGLLIRSWTGPSAVRLTRCAVAGCCICRSSNQGRVVPRRVRRRRPAAARMSATHVPVKDLLATPAKHSLEKMSIRVTTRNVAPEATRELPLDPACGATRSSRPVTAQAQLFGPVKPPDAPGIHPPPLPLEVDVDRSIPSAHAGQRELTDPPNQRLLGRPDAAVANRRSCGADGSACSSLGEPVGLLRPLRQHSLLRRHRHLFRRAS